MSSRFVLCYNVVEIKFGLNFLPIIVVEISIQFIFILQKNIVCLELSKNVLKIFEFIFFRRVQVTPPSVCSVVTSITTARENNFFR